MKRYLPNKSLYRLPFSHKIPWPTQRESSALTLLINFGMAEEVFAQRPRSSSHPMGCPWCHSAAATSLFRKATMVMGHQEWRNPSRGWKWDFFKQLRVSFLLCWYQSQSFPEPRAGAYPILQEAGSGRAHCRNPLLAWLCLSASQNVYLCGKAPSEFW